MRRLLWIVVLASPLITGCKNENPSTGDAAWEFQTKWKSEEHWMVDLVAKDLHDLAARTGVAMEAEMVTQGEAPREFLLGGIRLEMSPSCWDLASYEPLVSSWKIEAQEINEAGPELLNLLLTPSASNLQKANIAVSERLGKTPASALVHEEAAFLLGVFGMRENAWSFQDLRPLICSMTAHLAFARKLRGGDEASGTGKWAQVFFDYHAGRPQKALAEMDRISNDGDNGRWMRVMKLLITRDWRRTDDLSNPSLIEAIAHARALKTHRGNPWMLEFVKMREDLQETPEWTRLLLQSGRSVNDGHLTMEAGLPMEFAEMSQIFDIGDEPTPEKISKFLGVNHGRSKQPEGKSRVISDEDWAAYFRRHFFSCCEEVSYFTLIKWGSPEGAVSWRETVLPYLKIMPGHELVVSQIATNNAEYQEAMVETAEFILKNPEQTPMGLWYDYQFPTLEVPSKTQVASQIPWFREPSPPGTAHFPVQRTRFEGIRGTWLAAVTALHKIDPWDPTLCYEVAENTGENTATVKQAWGDMREYSVRPLGQTLEDPGLTEEERLDTLRIWADLDPSVALELGEMLVFTGRDEEAIKAYERAYENVDDRVEFSNMSLWMIYHYKSKGDDEKAREIADHNAEVYSRSGLISAMLLAIENKDNRLAMQYARAIAERYDDSDFIPVAAWAAGGDKKALASIFPKGMEAVTAADFQAGGKVKGALIRGSSTTLNAVKLRHGDVILAVNGIKVESFDQYQFLMTIKLDPRFAFIYRRGNKVMELSCTLPRQRLDCEMDDF